MNLSSLTHSSMLAFAFPGQGSQFAGMGKEVYQDHRALADDLYKRARQALGFDLQTLLFSGPEERLTLTEYAQPAMLLDSVIKYRILRERGLAPAFAAGHSLGEFSALVCAEVLSLTDGLTLTQKRGRYMQEAVPEGAGGMLAVMKLARSKVNEICHEAGVEIANYNSPQQIVISGRGEGIVRAKTAVEEAGGAAVLLKVSAPFHSSLMRPAEERLRQDLSAVRFARPAFPVISTVSGEPETDPQRIQDLLLRQMTAPVRWTDYVQRLKALGVSVIVEVGPGDVLTRLNRRIDAQIESLSFAQVIA